MRIASYILAIIGLGMSIYLAYVHYNLDALVCGTGGCEIVQTSRYSEVFGIPIALFGVAMFLVLLGLMLVRDRMPEYDDTASAIIVGILVTAVLYWAYLTYLELAVIKAVCQWCVATSIVTLLLLIVELWRFKQGLILDAD